MIKNQIETTKGMENAIKVLEQAKARLANEKKKQNADRRKAENRHKYMIGGIVHKYFPSCFQFEENELNQILSTAIANTECRNVIMAIENQNGFGSKKTDEGVKNDGKVEGSQSREK